MQKITTLEKANILAEALPYIKKLSGKTVVIKYGGNAMNLETGDTILEDVCILKFVGVNPILVHGGGPEINAMLDKLNIKPNFHKGKRITDEKTMEVVQMVLCGKINKDITGRLNKLGVQAIGLCGKDANLVEVKKEPPLDGVDLGFVGEIVNINIALLDTLCKNGFVPVISSVGFDKDGGTYNINADTVAGAVAASLKAEKLIFLTDIDGIYKDVNDKSSLCSRLNVAQVKELIKDGAIADGMIPKVLGCILGIERGINRTHIINGKMEHPILLEIFTDKGIGTMVTA
jgi:acetylglutamate kinase